MYAFVFGSLHFKCLFHLQDLYINMFMHLTWKVKTYFPTWKKAWHSSMRGANLVQYLSTGTYNCTTAGSYKRSGKTDFSRVQRYYTSRKQLYFNWSDICYWYYLDGVRVSNKFWQTVKVKKHLRSNNHIRLFIHLQLRWQIQKCNCCDCISDEEVRYAVRRYHENGQ